MSFIGKNIRKIRAVKKMSQSDFAKIIQVARPSIGAYEEGRAEPKIESIIKIAQHFGISIDTLLLKEITINELLKYKMLDGDAFERSKVKNKDDQLEATPYVNAKQYADYIVNYNKGDFINSLQLIKMPGLSTPKSRAFQVVGSEMSVNKKGIQHHDILITEHLNLKSHHFTVDTIYVWIMNDGIFVRRLASTDNNSYTLQCDNPSYEASTVSKEDVIEVWNPILLITNKFKDYTDVDYRLSQLEDKMNELLKQK